MQCDAEELFIIFLKNVIHIDLDYDSATTLLTGNAPTTVNKAFEIHGRVENTPAQAEFQKNLFPALSFLLIFKSEFLISYAYVMP